MLLDYFETRRLRCGRVLSTSHVRAFAVLFLSTAGKNTRFGWSLMTWRPYQTSWKCITYLKKIIVGGGGHRNTQKSWCCHQHTFRKIRQPSEIDYYMFHEEEHELRTKARILILCAGFKLIKSRRHKICILAIFLVVRTKNVRDGEGGGCKSSKIAPWEKLFVPLLNVRHLSHILTFLACFILTVYLHICSALYLSRNMSMTETNTRTGRSITFAVTQRVV